MAATEKSEFQNFGNGYRLITKNVLDVGFGPMAMNPEDCLANATAKYDLVAICKEHNLTDYKMAPPHKAAAQYALLTISGVRETAADAQELGRKTFMVDRMQVIDGPDNVKACQRMLGKLAHARSEFTFEGTKRDRSAWGDHPETQISSAKKWEGYPSHLLTRACRVALERCELSLRGDASSLPLLCNTPLPCVDLERLLSLTGAKAR